MNALYVMLLVMQTTQPTDATIDWLLDQSAPATQPAPSPTTQPATPFAERKVEGERAGVILRSDGKQIAGQLSTTPGKPVRVWESAKKRYVDLPWESIARVEAKVLWERDEPEWRFKESGHDEKVYTGKTYPARETEYTFTLVNGDVIEGGVVAPVYVRTGDETTQFVLHKRDKGPAGQTLGELVYVKRITFDAAGDVR